MDTIFALQWTTHGWSAIGLLFSLLLLWGAADTSEGDPSLRRVLLAGVLCGVSGWPLVHSVLGLGKLMTLLLCVPVAVLAAYAYYASNLARYRRKCVWAIMKDWRRISARHGESVRDWAEEERKARKLDDLAEAYLFLGEFYATNGIVVTHLPPKRACAILKRLIHRDLTGNQITHRQYRISEFLLGLTRKLVDEVNERKALGGSDTLRVRDVATLEQRVRDDAARYGDYTEEDIQSELARRKQQLALSQA